jgi:hypothetical protein
MENIPRFSIYQVPGRNDYMVGGIAFHRSIFTVQSLAHLEGENRAHFATAKDCARFLIRKLEESGYTGTVEIDGSIVTIPYVPDRPWKDVLSGKGE